MVIQNNSPVKEEDQVVEDIKSLAGFKDRLIARLRQIRVGGEKSNQKKTQTKNSKKQSIILISGFVLVLLVFAFFIMRNLQLKTEREIESTPTPFLDVARQDQSIYAKDAKILDLEETLRLNEAKLNPELLEETRLSPPTLNFDVSF